MKWRILPKIINYESDKLKQTDSFDQSIKIVSSTKAKHFNEVEKKKKIQFLVTRKSTNIPSVQITASKHTKTVTSFIYQIIRLNVQHKLQYPYGVKLSLFGYSDPNEGINQ